MDLTEEVLVSGRFPNEFVFLGRFDEKFVILAHI